MRESCERALPLALSDHADRALVVDDLSEFVRRPWLVSDKGPTSRLYYKAYSIRSALPDGVVDSAEHSYERLGATMQGSPDIDDCEGGREEPDC